MQLVYENFMKCFFLTVAVFCLFGKVFGEEGAAAKKALIQFEDSNFGIRFSHTDILSTAYNPHGGADRVGFIFKDEFIGEMLVWPSFEKGDGKDLVEKLIKDIKKDLEATDVAYRLYENPQKYKFHCLKIDLKIRGEDYVMEYYFYFSNNTEVSSDMVENLMKSIAGSFVFNFFYPKKDSEKLTGEIKTVIDTFRIDKGS